MAYWGTVGTVFAMEVITAQAAARCSQLWRVPE